MSDKAPTGKLKVQVVEEEKRKGKERVIELGNGSQLIYIPNFIGYQDSWNWFDYLNTHIPWSRPTLRVFGRPCLQPRETCYVAEKGLPQLVYSGYKPEAHSWQDFPPLLHLLHLVEEAVGGSKYNSLLINRYNHGSDYVGWHSDDEKLYGPTPQIASLSFGCERDFFLKPRPPSNKHSEDQQEKERAPKRHKPNTPQPPTSLRLKHGSLLVMRGYTQRDWLHSLPKRAHASPRINLTFRLVL